MLISNFSGGLAPNFARSWRLFGLKRCLGLHTALGNELADFMKGTESAEQALKDVEAAYIAAAKEKGFL